MCIKQVQFYEQRGILSRAETNTKKLNESGRRTFSPADSCAVLFLLHRHTIRTETSTEYSVITRYLFDSRDILEQTAKMIDSGIHTGSPIRRTLNPGMNS